MRAILLGNGSRDGVLEKVAELRPEIERVVDVVASDFEGKIDLSNVEADVAIVFGGDGSILRAVRQMNANQLPVLAINLGTLGFLASVNPDEAIDFMRSDAFQNYTVREQLLLICSVWRKKDDPGPEASTRLSRLAPELTKSPGIDAVPTAWRGSGDRYCLATCLVVNEVATRGGAPFSILKVELAVDGEQVTTVRCDGLIVSTPVGSTGHNLAAGGPILRNELDAVVVTPLNPQSLTFRPVVDSASRVYEMQVVSGKVFLTIDGDTRLKLSNDDLLVVRRAPFAFKSVRNPANRYYNNLQQKLSWGVDCLFKPFGD